VRRIRGGRVRGGGDGGGRSGSVADASDGAQQAVRHPVHLAQPVAAPNCCCHSSCSCSCTVTTCTDTVHWLLLLHIRQGIAVYTTWRVIALFLHLMMVRRIVIDGTCGVLLLLLLLLLLRLFLFVAATATATATTTAVVAVKLVSIYPIAATSTTSRVYINVAADIRRGGAAVRDVRFTVGVTFISIYTAIVIAGIKLRLLGKTGFQRGETHPPSAGCTYRSRQQGMQVSAAATAIRTIKPPSPSPSSDPSHAAIAAAPGCDVSQQRRRRGSSRCRGGLTIAKHPTQHALIQAVLGAGVGVVALCHLACRGQQQGQRSSSSST
jgi:hypothetical protein